jgi:long-chain fatty acid transport protein
MWYHAARPCFFIGFLLFSPNLHASFIESTMGAAVVDDATSTYYNPAALTLLKKTQLIALGSIGTTQTQFSGQSTQLATSYTQSGVSNAVISTFLPSFYFGAPVTNDITFGFAVIANDFYRNVEDHSILRYAQSNNRIQDIDLVPAAGFKLNKYISLGAGINRTHAHFLLKPLTGLPSLNIPDNQSNNESSGDSWGWDLGFLLKPIVATTVGFNYRSAITYEMGGNSTFLGYPNITSDKYNFNYWTPARSTFSISHFITPQLGVIGTIQFIQWSIFKDVTIHNIASRAGIIPSANVHYNFQDSFLVTVGSNYRISSKWIIRAAGSYTQSPSNGKFQIDTGDSITLGGSMGYTIFQNLILDCSYAHAFIKDQNIHATTAQNFITGEQKAAINAFALKLTVNV